MFIIRYHKYILGVCLLAVALSFVFIPNLKVEYDFRSFFVEGDEDLDLFEEHLKVFGTDDNVLLVAIYSENSIYNYELLKKVREFTIDCRRLPNVIDVKSIINFRGMMETPMGVMSYPLLHYKDTLRYSRDSLRIASEPLVSGWLVSNDARSTVVVIDVDSATDKLLKDELITNLDSLLEAYSFPQSHIAGTLNYETRYSRMIDHEIILNILFCGLVIILSLVLIFRTFSGVLIPSVTVIIAMIIFYGLLGAFNRRMGVLSTLYPTILLVVGTSNLIHIFSKYKDLLNKKLGKVQAIIQTFKELSVTIFLTSLTTAIGFFSLALSSMRPFREFGIEAGLGVLIAFIVSIVFVPSVFVIIKPEKINKTRKTRFSNWPLLLDRIYDLTIRHPRKILLLALIITIISVIGILGIDRNSYILSNFSDQSSLRKDFSFFEENFSGVRIFEMSIDVAEGNSITDIEVLGEIEKVHMYLEDISDFGMVYSPASVFMYMNQFANGGMPSSFELPVDQSVITDYDSKAIEIKRELYERFIDSTKTKGRITARMKDIGTERMKEFYESTDTWISENINSRLVEFKITGAAFLADKSNTYLSGNMLISLVLAFIAVSIIMFLLFMNLRMVIISLIPNVLPLLVIAGLIGFTGIVFNGPMTVIFTIGFVIAVDDTIHFLSKLKFELNRGQEIRLAIHTSMRETGKAIVITSIILFFGFMVLLHSDMREVFYQGLLVGIMLLTAVIADLFLLPVLLIALLEKKARKQK